MNTATKDPEVVSTRSTFDGVRVQLHANGEISDRQSFFRGKLPTAEMWAVWEDIGLYTHAEIPAMLRAVRAGKFTRFQVKPSIDHEGIMAENRARRVARARLMNESRKVRGLRSDEW
jgi:hypothetical protein